MFFRKKPQTKPNTVKKAELPAALWRKGLALVVSFSLLVTLIVVGTVAWYTRITNVTGITMQVAKFDFKADYVSEDFIVDVTDYMNVENGKAAPGTGGMIPILVSAENSEVDVDYTLNLDVTKMSPDFRRRIRFFYYVPGEDGTVNEVTIQKDSAEIRGTLQKGTSCYEYIYWQWVYTLSNELYYSQTQEKWTSQSAKFNQTQIDAFDAFDTKIGLGEFDQVFVDSAGKEWRADEGAGSGTTGGELADRPLLAYQKAMEAKLNISGAQAQPVEGTSSGSETGLVPGVTVRKSDSSQAGAGSEGPDETNTTDPGETTTP